MTAVRSDTTRYSEAAMDPVPESPPRWPCRWHAWWYEGPAPQWHITVKMILYCLHSGAEQERIFDFLKDDLVPSSRQYVYNKTRLQSSKVRNDARVDGKGAGPGSTYP